MCMREGRGLAESGRVTVMGCVLMEGKGEGKLELVSSMCSVYIGGCGLRAIGGAQP